MTIVLGLFLIILGAGAYGYALTDPPASLTALIPAFVGVPILLLGLWAKRSSGKRAMATHIAIVFAFIGLIGSGMRAIPALLAAEDLANPVATVVQLIMAVACLVYVALAVRSFVKARRGGG